MKRYRWERIPILLQYFYSLIHIIYAVLLAALFIFGLIQCKKHSFSGGFYFFVFLILIKIYDFILGLPIPTEYIRSFLDRTPDLSTRTWFYIGRDSIRLILNFCAYYFLVIGLYRMWKSNKTH